MFRAVDFWPLPLSVLAQGFFSNSLFLQQFCKWKYWFKKKNDLACLSYPLLRHEFLSCSKLFRSKRTKKIRRECRDLCDPENGATCAINRCKVQLVQRWRNRTRPKWAVFRLLRLKKRSKFLQQKRACSNPRKVCNHHDHFEKHSETFWKTVKKFYWAIIEVILDLCSDFQNCPALHCLAFLSFRLSQTLMCLLFLTKFLLVKLVDQSLVSRVSWPICSV